MSVNSRRAAAFFLLALPFLAVACSGGCGEEPGTGEETSEGGAPGSGPAKGSGDVNLSFYDSAEGSPKAEKAVAGGRRKATTARKAPVYPIRDLEPSGFSMALSGPFDVFIMTFVPACTPCEIVRPVIDGLSGEFDDMSSYRLAASKGKGFLPQKMSRGPYSGFLLYRNGRVLSTRKGLPLERRRNEDGMPSETVEAYQARLKDWFRGALRRRRLGSKGA